MLRLNRHAAQDPRHTSMIDIQRFCYPSSESAELAPSFPFQDEGRLIACNGITIVATTEWHGPHRAAPPGYAGIISRMDAMRRTAPPVSILSLQLQLPLPTPCFHCQGLGRQITQQENASTGRRCWHCFGTGERHQAVTVGTGLYEARQLRVLSTLAGCQLQPGLQRTPARLTFDGGCGFLFPTVPASELSLLSAAYERGFAQAGSERRCTPEPQTAQVTAQV